MQQLLRLRFININFINSINIQLTHLSTTNIYKNIIYKISESRTECGDAVVQWAPAAALQLNQIIYKLSKR